MKESKKQGVQKFNLNSCAIFESTNSQKEFSPQRIKNCNESERVKKCAYTYLSRHEILIIDHDHVYVGDGLRQVHACVDAAQCGFSEKFAGPDILLEEGLRRHVG